MRATTIIVAAILVLTGAAMADTHAPWPTDWNNWNDPAMWATVGDPGNVADTRYPDVRHGIMGFGAVPYTYKIGKFEVTAAQYVEFLSAVAKTDTYGLYNVYMASPSPDYGDVGCRIQRTGSPGHYTYSVASDYANRPVNYVSSGDAARFANWLTNGKPTGEQDLSTTEDGSYYLNGADDDAELLTFTRKADAKYVLPTLHEWHKAAYYKGGGTDAGYWDYTTRSNTPPGNDIADASGNNANWNPGYGPYPVDSGTYYTTVAGEFQNSASAYGTFDQGGNLWEWNETIEYIHRWNPGGAYYDTDVAFLSATHRDHTDHNRPALESGYGGFRIVEVPEPASLSLLTLTALALLKRRRRP